jgi:sulfite oxidase
LTTLDSNLFLVLLLVARIEVARNESQSHWQQNDYKSFNPSSDWDKVDFSTAPAIQEMPVTSVVCDPQDGETVELKEGKLKLKGMNKRT